VFSLGDEEFVHLEPMHEGVKPAIAGAVWVAETEAVAAVLVEVKFDRRPGVEPGLDNSELPAEEEVVSGDGVKHSRGVLRRLDRPHTAIDGPNEG